MSVSPHLSLSHYQVATTLLSFRLCNVKFQDAVEERSLVKVCGYPLCNKPHDASKIKQKFHISTVTNKVYDVEERKQFCSAACFKASNFFKDQLETSPLWLREVDTPVFAQIYTGNQEAPKEKNVQLVFDEDKAPNHLDKMHETTDAAEHDERKRTGVGREKEDVGKVVTDALRSWFTIDSFRLVAGEERLREEVCSVTLQKY